ncbi:MAG: hypothetical protein DMD51_07360 [Gemmatimonadetes bacterium]|nr:MAG: hypothetical protein DMD32_14215 [Gemmatimonadota bacterium]PYP25854.1 MAG: hypothetical protein DMD51_07360 [Gemmatimonadota bacterium]
MLSRRPRVGYAVCKSGHPMAPVTSYAARLQQIAHLQVPEAEAQRLWREISRHRRELLRRLGRDVGRRVALLDFLLNIHPQHVDATIIETAALDAIERRAISDALTGLYDRGYFEHALRRELQRCQRYGNPVSLLLLDLDEFKEINDEYGHRVGDKVLLAFGELIRKHLRGADVPCRLGGDEFAIILSDTAQPEARSVAERFRADVESWFETRPVCGQFLEVTVSGGIATAPFDATSQEQLYALADGALYGAKRRGSNRIETTSGDAHPGTPAAA